MLAISLANGSELRPWKEQVQSIFLFSSSVFSVILLFGFWFWFGVGFGLSESPVSEIFVVAVVAGFDGDAAVDVDVDVGGDEDGDGDDSAPCFKGVVCFSSIIDRVWFIM